MPEALQEEYINTSATLTRLCPCYIETVEVIIIIIIIIKKARNLHSIGK